MVDPARTARDVLAELHPYFDRRFRRMVERFPYVIGFLFGIEDAEIRSLPNFVPNTGRTRDSTFGVFEHGVLVLVLIVEWQTQPDLHMDYRAFFYIGERVHRVGSRKRVRMKVLHPLDFAFRGRIPCRWPWQADDTIFEWENEFLCDLKAEHFLRNDMPALAALSACGRGGTKDSTIIEALDLLLSMDCSHDDRVSMLAFHKLVAELHFYPGKRWMHVMKKLNPQVAEEVDELPVPWTVVELVRRTMAEIREQDAKDVRQAREALERTRAKLALAEAKLAEMTALAEAKLGDAEAHSNALIRERDAEIARLRAKLAAIESSPGEQGPDEG